jgi:hypothetical protein
MEIKKAAAISKAGGRNALARILCITPSAISQWGEHMPELQAYRLKSAKPHWISALIKESSGHAANLPADEEAV